MTEALSPVGRFQTILLATDGSEFSAAAEQAARDMAARCEARLLVTRVVLTNPEYEALVPDRVQQAEKAAQAEIDVVAEQARAAGLQVETLLRHGADPYHEVVRAADEKHADIIVMGRRARSDLARMLVGDSTAKVIGLASCSVLVLPRDTRMPESRILVATDGSRLGDAAAFSAVKLAQMCRLPLTAVSVIPSDSGDEQRRDAQAALTRVQAAAREAGLQIETRVEAGRRPDEVILKIAQECGADLLVLGSHGRTGLSRLLMGSVSERVLGHAKCPVLVVRASV